MNKTLIFLILFGILKFSAYAEIKEDIAAYNRAKEYWDVGKFELAAKEFKNSQSFSTPLSEKAAFAYSLAEEKSNNFAAAEIGYLYFINNFEKSEYLINAKFRLINLFVKRGEYAKAEYLLHTLCFDNEQKEFEKIKESLIIKCYHGLGQFSNVNSSIKKYIENFCDQKNCPYYKLWSVWYCLDQSDTSAELKLKHLIEYSKNEEVIKKAKIYLVPYLIIKNKNDEAVNIMLELVDQGVQYTDKELLWLARYLKENRELTIASDILGKIICKPENAMIEAIAYMELAQVDAEDRKFHDSLSNFPLIQKSLLNASANIGKIEVLGKLAEYYNAITLRKLGQTMSAHVILDRLEPSIYEPLYDKILYEQGMVALSMNKPELAVKNLMQVGILAKDPDLSGKALLRCYDACIVMNNSKLGKLCLEELVGKTEGSYGRLHANSPYTAQAYDILEKLED